MKRIKRSGFEFGDWEARSFHYGELVRARWCMGVYYFPLQAVFVSTITGYRYIIVVHT